jgi:hypothetical protein
MASMPTVLAFDIGIRNLAWCMMSQESGETKILGWENYDLLQGSVANAVSQKQVCGVCQATAKFQGGDGIWCGRHVPSSRPILRDLSGNQVARKIPGLRQLQVLCRSKPVPKTKSACLEFLAKSWSLPLEKPKVTKAVEMELTKLHDGIRSFLLQRKDLFHQGTEILLENQPVLKNPTMKSVQMLLFASLRDILQPQPPRLRLVHAKGKVQVSTKGDAGYKARKTGSEDKAISILLAGKIKDFKHWIEHLSSYSKKNDLTDAFCMCWDALGIANA